jgi:hypothetical protein
MTTIEFGDSEPEDEWDDGDPVALRLMLLGRILISIYMEAQNGDLERALRRKALIRVSAMRLFDQAMIELSN